MSVIPLTYSGEFLFPASPRPPGQGFYLGKQGFRPCYLKRILGSYDCQLGLRQERKAGAHSK